MRQYRKGPHNDAVPTRNEECDSPAIQHLIEQLDRDLEETQRKASKAQ
jgi:hypothetical protein